MIWLLALGVGGYFLYRHYHPASALVTDPSTVATLKMLLATWVASQGASYVSPANSTPGDPTEPTFKSWLAKFQVWANAGGVAGSTLRTDGVLDSNTAVTLEYWFTHQSGSAPAVSAPAA